MHGHRRRKKRPSYGIRTVEVNRGLNGFGFTISGQQPCILSCIVANSPADLAGLRAGDFLISVNGLNVSKLPHEAVVQLIGNTYGAIRMAIAENYYSDSSDEDIMFHSSQQRARPKYPHHKTKFHRTTTVGKQSNIPQADLVGTCESATAIVVNDSPATAYNVIHSPNASNSCDISNVSAMVRSVQLGHENEPTAGPSQAREGQEMSLEYKAIVGYLGTIEMPKQIATSSKLQTVRSCIRKMRQEKRNPTTVLMTILPSCLNLINTSNAVIAKYSSVRLNYVSSSSENDNRYFGLVTSAIYADGLMCENSDILNQRKDVAISNSCHVFVIDSKLVEHPIHLEKADLFKIICTKDPITNLCLEFPSNSEYVVNLIRSMYNLKAPIKPEGVPYGKPPVARSLNLDQPPRAYHRGLNDPRLNPRAIDDPHDLLVSNSPQPSNHSEITTTSSNSDSGIGFHNDCRNISDRILVVDFPGIPNHQIGNVRAHFRKSVPFGGALPGRPAGIIHELPPKLDPIRNIRSTVGVDHFGLQIYHGKSKSADYSYPSSSGIDRLTVRARPDPKSFTSDRSPSKDNAANTFNDQLPLLKYEPVYPEIPPLDDGWTSGKTIDELGNVVQERPIDVPKLEEVFLDLERYNTDNVKNSMLAARSCDDMILSLEKEIFDSKGPLLSVDDLTLVPKKSSSPVGVEHIFLQPAKPIKRSKKACCHKNGGGSNRQSATADDASVGSCSNRSSQLMSYKLSPKVFGLARPISASFENIATSTGDVRRKSGKEGKDEHCGDGGGGGGGERRSRPAKRLSGGFSAIWGSLQELRSSSKQQHEDSGSGVVTSSAAEVCDKVTRKQERRLSGFKILEGTYSEPDLRYDENKQINHNASPFRRWGQSSLRSRSGDQRTPSSSHRRPSSLAASESDVYTKSIDDDYSSTKSGYNPYADAASAVTTDSTQTTGGTTSGYSGPPGVASWGTSFEKLLEDAAGLHTFSEFLKKEFSAENIYFWTACERYRQITECEERAREAQAIFVKHLESGCSEPVNVDSIARNIAKEHLPQAEPTLFAAAQKQIFNLMKFDSYQRFIKSDMYKTCQDAEAKGHPLPYPGEQLDPLLRTGFALQSTTKLKKSLSNAEDRRRKSLLPWHRKTRCKSKDRADQEARKESGKSSLSNGGGTGGSSNTLKVLSTNSTSDIHSSRSSLASFDAAIGKSYDQDDTRNTLCRVILSNGATTVVQTRSNETIKELVERLLDKRGIVYNAYEAFLAGNHKPLDLDGPSSSLAGKEVNIDQRVVFKLSLPNRKMISVKSKATKPLGDVLRPILLKYNYELDQMNVYSKDAYLDMTYPVTSVDGLWLQVRNGNESEFHQDLTRTIASRSERAYANQAPPLPIIATSQHQQIINHFQQQLHHQQAHSQPHSFAMPSTNGGASNYITKKSQHMYINQSHNNNNNNNNNLQLKSKEEPKDDTKQELNMLDEITNKVFNELMNGKIVNGKVPEDCTSDSSSTRRDRFRRRGSNAPSESGRGAKSKKCSTAGSEDGGESVNNVGIKKPIIAKLKAGVKLQIPTRSQNDELLEGLKRAQRSRLEDQRGTEINFELPDFLKDKENFTTGGQSTTTAATVTSASTGGPQPSKLSRKPGVKRPELTTSSSVEFPLGSSTNGGSLQQINKPQPAPRLSITSTRGLGAGSGGSPTSPGGPVQSASSESNLNNLSLRCNASPLMLDDNGNGSQSENSYADTTLVFTHGPANACNSPESSPSSRAAHHRGSNFHLSSGDHYDPSLPANGCSSELQDGSITNSSGNYHPYHHHHHHHHHHGMAHHHQQQQQQQQHHHHLTASTSSASSSSTNSSNTGTSTSSSSSSDADNLKGPPPLPPKPKILPIKPSNWGHAPPGSNNSSAPGGSTMSTSLCNLSTSSNGNGISGNSSSSQNGISSSNSNSGGRERRSSGLQGGSLERQSSHSQQQQQKQPQQSQTRSVYLDHTTSSFV